MTCGEKELVFFAAWNAKVFFLGLREERRFKTYKRQAFEHTSPFVASDALDEAGYEPVYKVLDRVGLPRSFPDFTTASYTNGTVFNVARTLALAQRYISADVLVQLSLEPDPTVHRLALHVIIEQVLVRFQGKDVARPAMDVWIRGLGVKCTDKEIKINIANVRVDGIRNEHVVAFIATDDNDIGSDGRGRENERERIEIVWTIGS